MGAEGRLREGEAARGAKGAKGAKGASVVGSFFRR
jgi:hypothetical protein